MGWKIATVTVRKCGQIKISNKNMKVIRPPSTETLVSTLNIAIYRNTENKILNEIDYINTTVEYNEALIALIGAKNAQMWNWREITFQFIVFVHS